MMSVKAPAIYTRIYGRSSAARDATPESSPRRCSAISTKRKSSLPKARAPLEKLGAKATTEPASRPKAAKPKRVTAPGGVNARAARSPEEKTATANPRTRTAATPTARAGGRRDQLLALVVDQPGITLAQAAKQFGLKDATGLYAVARRLQDDGLVRKRGAELHPAA